MTDTKTIDCEEALRLLAAHLDGELDGREESQFEQHISTCRSCYSRSEFERQLKARVRDTGAVEVGAEFAERVQSLLQRFTTTKSE